MRSDNIHVAGLEDAQLDAQDFAGFLYQNPGARAIWNKREDNLATIRKVLRSDAMPDDSWTDTVRNYLAELDQSKPSIAQKSFVSW